MKRLGIIIVAAILLIGGGALTSLLSSGDAPIAPILTQTDNPDASRTTVLPWKAEQFFLMIGFIVFNLVGIGLTIAAIFWLTDRGIRRSRAAAQETNNAPQVGRGGQQARSLSE
ncbi:MAG: hypothetical protein HC828_22780 [Blastochloris sp.]|nr:hypothetical protein [Blastochloris sp.]